MTRGTFVEGSRRCLSSSRGLVPKATASIIVPTRSCFDVPQPITSVFPRTWERELDGARHGDRNIDIEQGVGPRAVLHRAPEYESNEEDDHKISARRRE